MFDTIYFRIDKTAFIQINIPGVGRLEHHFDVPADLYKALVDYANAQANLKVAEIQANMTAKTHNQAKGSE